MASIYKPHTYMLNRSQGTTILFGMAFMNALTAFKEFGPAYKFFGHGSAKDLSDLETFLREERKQGRKVQAIWAEFPANPLLVAPDISRLRDLADEYDVLLGIDDTIGRWANVDITALSDILVTSVTKSFNGYADAIAGSAILNTASARYRDLKSLFDEHYVPELYIDDTEAIERNSRDYPLAEWDKEETYDEQPPRYIHYSLAWKLTINGKSRAVAQGKEPDLVLAPGDYWADTLRPKLSGAGSWVQLHYACADY